MAERRKRDLNSNSRNTSNTYSSTKKLRPLVIVFILVLVVIVPIVVYLSEKASTNVSRVPDTVAEPFFQLEYENIILDAAKRYQVNPYLIAAVIKTESNFAPAAGSHAGAVGLMQVLPETARDMARWGIVDESVYLPDNLEDPATNIEYGTAYLRYLVERYHEIEPALAAYNGGMANADRWTAQGENIRDFIDFPETADYVVSVVRAKERYENLYPDVFEGWE